ncbi:DNA polymerase subunit gamma-1-like protein [Leptotrombidium deliense]|uniref:DNA-directed DNA polymerase n=1 Tax=Leptotrombidium deliense TaxID=299467 RepID=A0A443SHE5_9ACAR|nr:DNA polymerase subunit gamma-1-like protein [Leptotrombidium deliense]
MFCTPGIRCLHYSKVGRHKTVHLRYLCSKVRRNQLEIQLICDSLRKKIFGSGDTSEDSQKLESVKQHLKKHGLWKLQKQSKTAPAEDKPSFTTPTQEPVDICIPSLNGENVEEHFQNIGLKYSESYKQLADEIVQCVQLPSLPKEWVFSSGWTRYDTDGNGNVLSTQRVDFPTENAIVFDVEVCMNDGKGDKPTMATAVSKKYWYSWCSSRLIDAKNCSDYLSFIQSDSEARLTDLIQMGRFTHKERLLIGHNVSFDRSFVKEQYDIKGEKTRFMDTMSLHIALSGLTGYQRSLSFSYNVAKKRAQKQTNEDSNGFVDFESNGRPNPLSWAKNGSLNNLVDVYRFYCDKELSKEQRDIFVKGSLSDIKDNFQNLMTYCAKDVIATFEVFQEQWKQFTYRFPHPVTLAGMLEMSVMYLPVNTSNWKRYLEESQTTYDDMERELTLNLQHLANDTCRLLKNEEYRNDIWLWDLDWSTQNIRFRQTAELPELIPKKSTKTVDGETGHESKFVKDLLNSRKMLKKVQPLLPGYPLWYREFCDRFLTSSRPLTEERLLEWEPGPFLISTQMRSVPKLMRLMWNGYALHYDDNERWGYLVPNESLENIENIEFPIKEYYELLKVDLYSRSNKDVVFTELEQQEIYKNIDNPNKRIKTEFEPISKFGCKFYRLPHKDGAENKVGNPLGKEFLRYLDDGTLTTFSNATANLILKLSKALSYWKMNQKRIYSQMVVENDSISNFSSLLPRVVVAGTVTRRAVEGTWLTASNAYEDRVGSELKAMIQVPKGYKFVGADVDSQELWIASLLGDSYFAGMHGCTAVGWMTLQGSRADGTDMHSKVSSLVGISRDQAKVLNYGRIYGAGKAFAARFLKLSNPLMSEEEAKRKAFTIYKQTKGRRVKESGMEEVRQKWEGGSESHLFNQLEQIANSPEPCTPVLGCRISTALMPKEVREDFITSVINWVVQSSGVDYLHLMLVAMKWLMDHYQIDGRFSISIHDEIRYIIAEKDQHKAALALQIANLLTRSIFSYKLSIMDLPQSVAFFSRVDIDTVLRKEVYMDCKTPSNPHGLSNGYNIPNGKSLTIYDLLKIEEIKKLVTPDKQGIDERRDNKSLNF